MVTKGIITSIDFNGNTCQVRIPFFETAGNDPITGTAIVSNTPGSYNGYKIGDVVLVAFEDGKMHNPVIIGKLYLGAAKEKQDPRGTINVETTTASKSASLPADAVLTANVDSNVPNTNTPFGSLASIANNLNSLNTDVNQLDRFTRNQFNSVITDVNEQGEQIRSEIKQTADSIEANVVHKHQDGSQNALGWDLTTDSWQINAQDTVNGEVKDINIVTIDRSGMSIAGDLKLSGYPKNTTVLYAQNESDKNYPTPLYKFTKADFPASFPSGDEDKDKTWYYGKYIKIIEAGEEKYVLVFKENFEQYDIKIGTTIAHNRNINPSWSTETPERVDGKYIWQWMHTEIYSFDGNKWSEKDDDKIACITGAQGEKGDTGVAINNNKQWYILWPASATNKPSKPTNNTEPTEPATPSTVESWMSTPPEAANGYVVWTCYGSIFSDDTPENRHIKYSDPVKDNAYALAQGKTTNYYSDTDPSKAYSVKKGDCWFDTSTSGQETLKQWDGNAWQDIGGELVTNKVTANYINALDITAKKITVLNDNNTAQSASNPILFEADGLSGTGSVKIANFTVKNDKIYSGNHDTINSSTDGIYLGKDGLSIGSKFKVQTNSVVIADYTKSTIKKYRKIEYDNEAEAAAHYTDWKTWTSSNWLSTVPEREEGKYIWEWTKEEKGDNTYNDLGRVCITGSTGDTGATGTSVSECKTYYSLSNTTSSTGPATGDSNIVTTPTINKWSTSPQAFDKNSHQGYIYWTVERRVYTNNNVLWGTPVKASMLSVDFIDSLGITAKKITVKDGNNKLFEADSIDGNNTVYIAGFDVSKNSILNGTLGETGSVFMSTGSDGSANIAGSGSKTGWAFAAGNSFGVTKNGNLYASNVNISGGSIKVGNNFSVNNSGKIESTGGTIGGFNIDSNRLFSGIQNTDNWLELVAANLIAYKSNNQGVASSYAVSKITVNKATNLTVYIRSYAESSYDYTMISNPNASSYPTSYSSSYVKAHTRSNQNSSSALTDYTKVEYYGLKQNDYIYIVYMKDGSADSGTDTGYLLIPDTTDISISNVGATHYFVRDPKFDIKSSISVNSGTIGPLTINADKLGYYDSALDSTNPNYEIFSITPTKTYSGAYNGDVALKAQSGWIKKQKFGWKVDSSVDTNYWGVLDDDGIWAMYDNYTDRIAHDRGFIPIEDLGLIPIIKGECRNSIVLKDGTHYQKSNPKFVNLLIKDVTTNWQEVNFVNLLSKNYIIFGAWVTPVVTPSLNADGEPTSTVTNFSEAWVYWEQYKRTGRLWIRTNTKITDESGTHGIPVSLLVLAREYFGDIDTYHKSIAPEKQS